MERERERERKVAILKHDLVIHDHLVEIESVRENILHGLICIHASSRGDLPMVELNWIESDFKEEKLIRCKVNSFNSTNME